MSRNGNFITDIGHDLGRSVSDIGHSVASVGDAVSNTAKLGGAVAEHVLNPTKWDNAARWMGDHGDEVAKVGWQIAKDQLNPTKADFWINAGTLALTVASGGTAAPVALARGAELAGTAAKTAKVASATIKGAEAANVAAKGVEAVSAASKAAEAIKVADKVSDVARAADKVGDVARVADKVGDVSRVAETASRTGQLAQGASEAAKTGSTFGQKAEKVLDFATKSRTNQVRTAARGGKLGRIDKLRNAAADAFLVGGKGGAEAPSIGRKIGSAVISGEKAVKPTMRSADVAQYATKVDDAIWYGQRLNSRSRQLNNAKTTVDVMADPEKAVTDAATKSMKSDTGKGSSGDLRQPQRQQSTVGSGDYADTAALTTSQVAPASTMRVGYANEYTPRGYTAPSASSPVRGGSSSSVGQAPLTTSVRDPYVNGTVGTSSPSIHDPYSKNTQGSPGAPYKVRDPYKPLTQPKGY